MIANAFHLSPSADPIFALKKTVNAPALKNMMVEPVIAVWMNIMDILIVIPVTAIQVLIFCVEFWELFHITRDSSQAEKKITVITSLTTDKLTTIFTQNDNFDNFE